MSSGPLSDGPNLNVGDQVGCQISGHLDGAFSTKLVDVRVRQNALAALHHRSSQGSAQDFFSSRKFPPLRHYFGDLVRGGSRKRVAKVARFQK